MGVIPTMHKVIHKRVNQCLRHFCPYRENLWQVKKSSEIHGRLSITLTRTSVKVIHNSVDKVDTLSVLVR